LWKSDGTADGTTLVRALAVPSGAQATVRELTNVAGRLFFVVVDTYQLTNALWTSDGTAAGTTALITNTASTSGIANLTAVGGTLFFTRYQAASGTELWKSDGTPAGTVLAIDINPGAAGSSPSQLRNVAGTLFFTAHAPGDSWADLWKSDGTEAGTVVVKVGANQITALKAIGATLFFAFSDGPSGQDLWKSDGTEAGTVMVKDLNQGSWDASPTHMTDVAGTLFFTAFAPGDLVADLWKSDGTEAGTSVVLSGAAEPAELTAVGGALFFTYDDGVNGRTLEERRHSSRHGSGQGYFFWLRQRRPWLAHRRRRHAVLQCYARRPDSDGTVEERWHRGWHSHCLCRRAAHSPVRRSARSSGPRRRAAIRWF